MGGLKEKLSRFGEEKGREKGVDQTSTVKNDLDRTRPFTPRIRGGFEGTLWSLILEQVTTSWLKVLGELLNWDAFPRA